MFLEGRKRLENYRKPTSAQGEHTKKAPKCNIFIGFNYCLVGKRLIKPSID